MPRFRDYCVPRLIDWGCGQAVFAQQRSSIVAHASGRVLDVFFGSGPDLPYYDPSKVSLIWRALTLGCHLNRPVSRYLESAGFRIQTLESGYLPGLLKIAGYHYRGVALNAK